MVRSMGLALLCVVSLSAYAQQKAVTDRGEEVLLYDDGTWSYAEDAVVATYQVPVNPTPMVKPEDATFLLKSKRLQMGVYLNPKRWTFQAAETNPEAEYEFHLRDEDLYAMLISERVAIPLESLRSIALENGRAVAPDLKIDHQEYRVVNGLTVLLLQMSGTMQGIKFTYYGYYYSNEQGTVQLVTYTAQNLLSQYQAVADELLNGLVPLKD